MKDSRGIVKFFDKGYILRFFLLIMLFSIFIPAEILMVHYLQNYMSIYLLVAGMTALSLFFLPLSYMHVLHYIKKIRGLIYAGGYPENELVMFAGAVIGGIFLIVPGAVSTGLGIVLLFSIPKKISGYLFMRMYPSVKKDIYEYLKLYSG